MSAAERGGCSWSKPDVHSRGGIAADAGDVMWMECGDVCPCRSKGIAKLPKSSQVKSSQVKWRGAAARWAASRRGSTDGASKRTVLSGKRWQGHLKQPAGGDRRRNMRRAGQLTRTLRGMGYPYRTFIVCSTGPITHTCLISANVTRRRPGTRPPASTALLDSTSVDLPFSLFILLSPTDRYSPLIFTLHSHT